MEYYGSILGRGNLYVIFDGKDQQIPDFCSGVNVIVKDRVEGKVVKADKGRIRCISSLARGLMERYDLAIGVDVDEFLVVDPACGVTLPEYLDSIDIKSTVSGLGVDVGQHLEKESEVDPGKPFLSQRHFGYLSSRYTKASVIAGPQRWGSGFHRVKGRNFHIDPNLYLFHFGCVDFRLIEQKMGDREKIMNGWSRHLRKRVRTIRIITSARPRRWESTVRIMRLVQTVFRVIIAPNKPSDMSLRVVVEIPERFRNTV